MPTPTYTPNPRDAKGVQTFLRPAMDVSCDVCNIPRTRGNHERCSKIRQAAGFVSTRERKA
ncbi:hypothetical protein [Pseudomonas putida]|uniref:hypothetical protein n=1 Tax=Pseudomonas putida TaxID=303 RepID=UPI001F20AAA7|nr:hypothetical protein [Pseudomonas putida]